MISVITQRQTRAVAAFELFSAVAGSFVALMGALVLIGWWRNIEALRTIIPGHIQMIPNTAVAGIIGGIGLIFMTRSEHDERARKVGRGFAIALTTLGALFFHRARREGQSRDRSAVVRE